MPKRFEKMSCMESVLARNIMTPYVYMLDSNASLEQVISFLYKKKISAVIISHDSQEKQDRFEKKYYIISQTDIVNFLATGGIKDPLLEKVPASRIMNGPMHMLDEETPLDLVIRFMADNNYKRVLISKENAPVGIITTRDIMVWNDIYFKSAKPFALLFIKRDSGILVGKYIFKENLAHEKEKIDKNLLDLYGGALNSITAITDEVLKKKDSIKTLVRKKSTILLEEKDYIISILICDNNSIELRTRLIKALDKFYEEFAKFLVPHVGDDGIEREPTSPRELNIDKIASIFHKTQDLINYTRCNEDLYIEIAKNHIEKE